MNTRKGEAHDDDYEHMREHTYIFPTTQLSLGFKRENKRSLIYRARAATTPPKTAPRPTWTMPAALVAWSTPLVVAEPVAEVFRLEGTDMLLVGWTMTVPLAPPVAAPLETAVTAGVETTGVTVVAGVETG